MLFYAWAIHLFQQTLARILADFPDYALPVAAATKGKAVIFFLGGWPANACLPRKRSGSFLSCEEYGTMAGLTLLASTVTQF